MSISTISPDPVPSSSVSRSSPLSNLSVESRETSEERSVDNGLQFSGVTSFAMAMHLSELKLSSNTTQFAYRSDNSLAVQARSQVNFSARTEEFRFDITLSAESIGLTKDDFANPTKPMTIQLTYAQSQLQLSQKLTIQEVQTLRKPEEIIQDLVNALTEIFKDPGNKTVSYVLDSEAMKSLAQTDPKLARLFGELVMIMAMVNLMKRQGEDRNDYTILLSGKGKPYMDIQQEIDGELVNQTYEFNITVLAPEAKESIETNTSDELNQSTEITPQFVENQA